MRGDIEVRLNMAEALHAATVACSRQIENLLAKRPDRYGASPDDGWGLHVNGCFAEKAVAKVLRIEWTGNLSDLTAKDVGPFQVRSTTHENGSLILHDADPDDDVFFLVTGRFPVLTIRGCILARDGKQPEFWRDPSGKGRHAFFIPQNRLFVYRPAEA